MRPKRATFLIVLLGRELSPSPYIEMNTTIFMRLTMASCVLCGILLGQSCTKRSGTDVELLVVERHSGASRAEVRDRETIARIMKCFDRRTPEINKFMMRYKLTIHYVDGRLVEAWVGGKAVIVGDDHFALPCDLGEALRQILEGRN